MKLTSLLRTMAVERGGSRWLLQGHTLLPFLAEKRQKEVKREQETTESPVLRASPEPASTPPRTVRQEDSSRRAICPMPAPTSHFCHLGAQPQALLCALGAHEKNPGESMGHGVMTAWLNGGPSGTQGTALPSPGSRVLVSAVRN